MCLELPTPPPLRTTCCSIIIRAATLTTNSVVGSVLAPFAAVTGNIADIPPCAAVEFPMDQRGLRQSGLLPVFGSRGRETLARWNGVVGCNRSSPVA
jgi:hypothetical protein